jgi:hypothetical protein
MASISQLESLLARVRGRAAEPRPRRPASRVSLRSYAEIEDDDIEEYEDDLVEIVEEPAPAPVALRPSSLPPPLHPSPVPATQRSDPPPPPLPPPPRPPPTWDMIAARARRSIRPVIEAPAVNGAAPAAPASEPPLSQPAPGVPLGHVVARSPLAPSTAVAESRGQLRTSEAESFADLLERSLELG